MAKDKEEKKDEKADKADKAEASPEEAAAKAKKKRLLIFIIGGVLLAAGVGGGLAFFMAGGGDAKMAAKSGDAGAEGEKKEGEGEKKEGEKKEGEKKEGEAKKEGEGEKKEGEKKEGGEAKKDDKKDAKNTKLEGVDFGCTLPFQAFHLNLGNPLENRYIRLEIAVEYGCNDEIKAEIEKRLPQLRDAVISVTSRKTREFLLGPDGKEQLRKEIHNRLNHYMSHKLDDVFITDILIE
jgi:flagellar FliL protein